jgi:hypothetical protein
MPVLPFNGQHAISEPTVQAKVLNLEVTVRQVFFG